MWGMQRECRQTQRRAPALHVTRFSERTLLSEKLKITVTTPHTALKKRLLRSFSY